MDKRKITTEDEIDIRSDMVEFMDKLQAALADVEDIIEDRKIFSDNIAYEFDYEPNNGVFKEIDEFSEVTEKVKNAIERI
jgi:hypothetical protein